MAPRHCTPRHLPAPNPAAPHKPHTRPRHAWIHLLYFSMSLMRFDSVRIRTVHRAGLLGASLLLAACGATSPEVTLSSAAPTPTSTAAPEPTVEAISEAVEAVGGDATSSAREATSTPVEPERAAPLHTPEAQATPALALRTRRPVDGFDLTPPEGFFAVEYHPSHSRSMTLDGRRGGVRFYHRHGTTQSVVVSAWSAPSKDAENRFDGHRAHGGSVAAGRPVTGAAEVWELRGPPASQDSSRISLSVDLEGGGSLWLSGTDLESPSLPTTSSLESKTRRDHSHRGRIPAKPYAGGWTVDVRRARRHWRGACPRGRDAPSASGRILHLVALRPMVGGWHRPVTG